MRALTRLYTRRYAETQRAPNGMRYRDWLCVFANEQVIEKAKLDAHVLHITGSYHEALVPWRRDAAGTTELVLTRSSLPLEQRVMHDRAQADGPSRFTSFVRSAKARLLQDLKSLPIPQGARCHINRTNTSFYEDESAGQILLVYAPDEAERLEFVSMTLLPPAK